MRHETPLDIDLVDELMDLWLPIFVEGIDLTREALLGEEMPEARITVYTRKIENRLSGACLVASSDSMPSLGGLGEVATSPAARRTGIATALTQQAFDDFGDRGGQALFPWHSESGSSANLPPTRLAEACRSETDAKRD